MQALTYRRHEGEATGGHPSLYSDGDGLGKWLLGGLRVELSSRYERKESEEEATAEETNELHG